MNSSTMSDLLIRPMLHRAASAAEVEQTILQVADDDDHSTAQRDSDPGADAIDQDRARQQRRVLPHGPVAEDVQATGENKAASELTTLDFPRPPALESVAEFIFNEDSPVASLYRAVGQRLAASGDIYRRPGYANGLLLASQNINVPPTPIDKGTHLVAACVDRLPVTHVKNNKIVGHCIPVRHANTMLQSELFLQEFRTVDEVVRTARYMHDFRLTLPGYNDGGRGERFLHAGPPARIDDGREAVETFLGVMDFDTVADRTNAVAAALTIMLRNLFPGAKPLILATATKSHAGKDTIIQFACGNTPMTAISYQETDWALERAAVGTLKHNPEAGVLVIENARLGKRSLIASAFFERFITDREPTLFSTGSGGPVRRKNDIVVAISTNFGTVSEDLMNRSLPIHLAPTGNVADRQSAIGNPKLEFLPRNRERIEAEVRGMVERWKRAGQPHDTNVRHPFTHWAAVVGGILAVNGFTDFLANYKKRRTEDDPQRRSLGILGAARPDDWLRTAEWAELVESIGLVKTLIPEADRGTPSGRTRGIGVVLSAHEDETFHIETEDEQLILQR